MRAPRTFARRVVTLLRTCAESRALRGVSVAIYNPALDPSGDAARLLVQCLAEGLGDDRLNRCARLEALRAVLATLFESSLLKFPPTGR